MSFDFLYQPVEHLDGSLTGLFDGAGLLVALALAFLLGLRHASELPSWLETGAERAVGVVILVLAARMLLTRRRRSRHEAPAPSSERRRPLRSSRRCRPSR